MKRTILIGATCAVLGGAGVAGAQTTHILGRDGPTVPLDAMCHREVAPAPGETLDMSVNVIGQQVHCLIRRPDPFAQLRREARRGACGGREGRPSERLRGLEGRRQAAAVRGEDRCVFDGAPRGVRRIPTPTGRLVERLDPRVTCRDAGKPDEGAGSGWVGTARWGCVGMPATSGGQVTRPACSQVETGGEHQPEQ